jgi:hypothetical protein
MKKYLQTLKRVLRHKGGETLMEGIVSLLIFTLLIAAVTLMLNWSLRETSATIREGNAMQKLADDALLGENVTTTDVLITLTVTTEDEDGDPVDNPIPITIDITDDEFVAFFPPTPSPSTTPP